MPKHIIPSSDEQNLKQAYAGQDFDIEETEVEDGTMVLTEEEATETAETGTMVLFDEDEDQTPTPVISSNRNKATIPEPVQPYTETKDNFPSRVVEDLSQVQQPLPSNNQGEETTKPEALDKDFGFDVDDDDFDITGEATTVLDFEDGTDELQPYTPPAKPKGSTQKLVEHESRQRVGYVAPTFNNTSGQGMFTEEEKQQLEAERQKKIKDKEQKQANLNSGVAMALAKKLRRDPSEFKQNIYDDSATAALYYSGSDSNEKAEADFMNQVRNTPSPRQEIPADKPGSSQPQPTSTQPARFNTQHNFTPEDLEADADMGLTKKNKGKKVKKPKKLNSGGLSIPMILFLVVAGAVAVYALFFM